MMDGKEEKIKLWLCPFLHFNLYPFVHLFLFNNLYGMYSISLLIVDSECRTANGIAINLTGCAIVLFSMTWFSCLALDLNPTTSALFSAFSNQLEEDKKEHRIKPRFYDSFIEERGFAFDCEVSMVTKSNELERYLAVIRLRMSSETRG